MQAEGEPVRGGHPLLWMAAASALVIGGLALMLWGTRSSTYLLDLMLALCA
jgi:hypothetical protein